MFLYYKFLKNFISAEELKNIIENYKPIFCELESFSEKYLGEWTDNIKLEDYSSGTIFNKNFQLKWQKYSDNKWNFVCFINKKLNNWDNGIELTLSDKLIYFLWDKTDTRVRNDLNYVTENREYKLKISKFFNEKEGYFLKYDEII